MFSRRIVLVVSLLVGVWACPLLDWPPLKDGCSSNMDCLNGKVCTQAVCVRPGESASSSSTSSSSGGGSTSSSGGTCLDATVPWQNVPISQLARHVTVRFSVTPTQDPVHGVVALSVGPAAQYEDAAVLIRLKDARWDARNGPDYSADQFVPFEVGQAYSVRAEVSVATRTYSVFVTPPAGQETMLASNYAFRTEQSSARALGSYGLRVESGGLRLCGVAIQNSAEVSAPPPYTRCAAQCRYVRAGATGNSSGQDWENAFPALPAALERGATYFVAGGAYAGYSFTTPAQGTDYITVKKATDLDHGNSAGWQSEWGVQQAVFGPMSHNVAGGGYLDFNGQAPYGFKIEFSAGQVGFNFVRGGSFVSLRYVDLDGAPQAATSTRGVHVAPGDGATADSTTGIVLSHSAVHGGSTLLEDTGANGRLVVEHSDLYDANRALVAASDRGTFANNRVHSLGADGLYFPTGQSEWRIFGNVFYAGASANARGVELAASSSHLGILVYNNTFAHLTSGSIGDPGNGCSSCEAKNNLAFDAPFAFGALVQSFNTSVAADPFVDLAAGDLSLAAPTPGVALSAEYSLDPSGLARGQDGTWDRGAFEFAMP